MEHALSACPGLANKARLNHRARCLPPLGWRCIFMSLCITDLYEHALLERHRGLNRDPPAALNFNCCRRMRIFRKPQAGRKSVQVHGMDMPKLRDSP